MGPERGTPAGAVRPGPQHATIAGPRGPIAYERWGGGPPLLLLAGLGSRARLWGELPRLLADRFTVLAPDNRGVGGSRGGETFTLAGAADDAAAGDRRRRLRAPPGCVGVSMGGLDRLPARRAPPRAPCSGWSSPRAPPA